MTARQLAKFQGKSMTYEHLKLVFTVACKFDTYLKKVRVRMISRMIRLQGGLGFVRLGIF